MPAPSTSAARRFGIRFAVCCTGIFLVLNLIPRAWLGPVCAHTARTLGQTLKIAGWAVSVRGAVVAAPGFAVDVIPECTALFPAGLYLSFLAAYPAPAGKRLTGLAAGLPAIWAGNLLRLALVFVIGLRDRGLFDAVHVYFGQVFTVGLVFMACLIWQRTLRNGGGLNAQAPRPAAFLARLLAISTAAFFLWLNLNAGYIWLVDQCMSALFGLFGRSLDISRSLAVYYYTFNIVVFTSLVLATHTAALRRRMAVLAGGLCLLFTVHLCYRICNTLVTAYHLPSFLTVGLVLSTLGQYLLPVVLWAALAARVGDPGRRDSART